MHQARRALYDQAIMFASQQTGNFGRSRTFDLVHGPKAGTQRRSGPQKPLAGRRHLGKRGAADTTLGCRGVGGQWTLMWALSRG